MPPIPWVALLENGLVMIVCILTKPQNTALNEALLKNGLVMIVCILTKIPVFIGQLWHTNDNIELKCK
ncbi:hypothetical protein Glove_600g4 [Diversispora epigaea]|uniref:Uncharacterized protein n=1 Tax=Diversispora epigaea TaxID=1348612 RepID=A0A397GAR5_9GLOM|nr:hypothetical protein Glove_600g4 [Diversispora epigaea]